MTEQQTKIAEVLAELLKASHARVYSVMRNDKTEMYQFEGQLEALGPEAKQIPLPGQGALEEAVRSAGVEAKSYAMLISMSEQGKPWFTWAFNVQRELTYAESEDGLRAELRDTKQMLELTQEKLESATSQTELLQNIVRRQRDEIVVMAREITSDGELMNSPDPLPCRICDREEKRTCDICRECMQAHVRTGFRLKRGD